MAQVRSIAEALRPSVDVDDVTWGVFVDALGDAALAGGQAAAEVVLAEVAVANGSLDVQVDLLPPR